MKHIDRAEAIRGKTVRLTWTEGPTQGATHEHVFHQDGTVEWHDAGGAEKGAAAKERPPYAAVEVADGVYAVSYLAASGYTLTVVLNFRDRKVVGFASSAKDWHPVRGSFEVVG
jgi:hypothetical protein